MNKKISIYALATLTLMACSSSDDDGPQGVPPAKRPLTVVVNETPFVDENGDAQAPMRQGTRGSEITTGSLQNFKMYSSDTYYNLSKNNNQWKSDPVSWPSSVGDDEEITFYAYNAGTYYYNSGNSYISFEVNENASTQTDLLVAKQTTSYSVSNGQVSLTFDHACAAVDFELRISDLLAKTHNTLYITDIKLKNVANEGDYYYNNGGWKDINGKGTYTLNNVNMSLTKEPQAPTCGTLFMIPQTLGDDAVLSFKYEGVEKTISLKGAEWKEGTQYVMEIVIGKKTLGL